MNKLDRMLSKENLSRFVGSKSYTNIEQALQYLYMGREDNNIFIIWAIEELQKVMKNSYEANQKIKQICNE